MLNVLIGKHGIPLSSFVMESDDKPFLCITELHCIFIMILVLITAQDTQYHFKICNIRNSH